MYFKIGGQIAWNPSMGIGRLYVKYLAAVEEILQVPAGAWPVPHRFKELSYISPHSHQLLIAQIRASSTGELSHRAARHATSQTGTTEPVPSRRSAHQTR